VRGDIYKCHDLSASGCMVSNKEKDLGHILFGHILFKRLYFPSFASILNRDGCSRDSYYILRLPR
jgi:hypothetical protein